MRSVFKIVNKRRPRKIRPPYRRYGPGVATETLLDSEFEKVDVLSASLQYLKLKDDAEANGQNIDDIFNLEDDETNSVSVSSINRLPPEILDNIFEFLPKPISPDILYVNRLWCSLLLPRLYECPKLDARNYPKFIATIGSSNHLGGHVKILDLRGIVQSGKNSSTAKVLRRCSKGLRSFIAPQTSFGYSPLISLKNCTELRTLDLALVSETVDLRQLFQAISSAKYLERLSFPRSSVFCTDYDHLWPPNLWHLCLSGGISNEFLMVTKFPKTITNLIMTHCPFITTDSVHNLFSRLGSHLTTLKVVYPMPGLRPNALDSVFRLCPKLKSLSVSVDYISRHMFEISNMPFDQYTCETLSHPLTSLNLDSSGSLGQAHKIEPFDISLAILEEKLPYLKRVSFSFKLGWNANSEDMIELAEILEQKDGEVWSLDI